MANATPTKPPSRNPILPVTIESLGLQFADPNLSARPFQQAYAMQRVLFSIVMCANTPLDVLASLIRAWDVLEERKRILRGVPLPGQLRPDLDPLQLMKAVKRSRSRKPLELAGDSPFSFPGDVAAKVPPAESNLSGNQTGEIVLDKGAPNPPQQDKTP